MQDAEPKSESASPTQASLEYVSSAGEMAQHLRLARAYRLLAPAFVMTAISIVPLALLGNAADCSWNRVAFHTCQ